MMQFLNALRTGLSGMGGNGDYGGGYGSPQANTLQPIFDIFRKKKQTEGQRMLPNITPFDMYGETAMRGADSPTAYGDTMDRTMTPFNMRKPQDMLNRPGVNQNNVSYARSLLNY